MLRASFIVARHPRPMASGPDAPFAAQTADAALTRGLARVARLHEERRANPALEAALERLGRWQALRLRRTYADLEAQPRYAAAVEFFESDLYGGADFAQRDADVARVAPVMVLTLPERVIATIAEAMELNALSQELDRALLARLPGGDGRFTVAEYCNAYRRPDDRPSRERQIALVCAIGEALDRIVRMPLVHAALVMMRQPARLAGMGVLHDFLERGFDAFRIMNGGQEFLATIAERETALMNAIFGGAKAPFPDPLSAAEG
jgi:hypothetical protein